MTDSWLSTTHAQLETAKTLVTGLTDSQFNWHPDSEMWSLGQQLDHLCVVLEKATAEIDKGLAASAPAGSAETWKPGFLERKFIAMVGAQPGGRTNPVPKGFEPEESALAVAPLLARFVAAQTAFADRIEKTRAVDVKRVKVASAAVPLLKLSLGAWFAAMAVHTQYHLDKATALRQRPEFPT